MPHFRFAYPVRVDDKGGSQVYVSCRDLPELSVTASGTMESIFDAIEAAIDRAVAPRLANNTVPSPSPREPGEIMVTPTASMIAKIVRSLEEKRVKQSGLPTRAGQNSGTCRLPPSASPSS